MAEETKNKESPSLEERITKIELLLEGDDKEPNHSNWSYEQIRVILDKSGLSPNMARNQELCGLDKRVDIVEGVVKSLNELIEALGHTEAHIGKQTLAERLNIIEGMQSIFCSAHKGHTNYEDAEYYSMHDNIEAQRGQLDAIQKKMDRVTKLLENAKFTLTGKEALKL